MNYDDGHMTITLPEVEILDSCLLDDFEEYFSAPVAGASIVYDANSGKIIYITKAKDLASNTILLNQLSEDKDAKYMAAVMPYPSYALPEELTKNDNRDEIIDDLVTGLVAACKSHYKPIYGANS
ncbi:hypothetical protein I3271_07205 [Photobacterium leiognathi]|uniref:hypothetical protein n=1 Tax=Photobacterium leiognathi TaxID=553611 RepID=UPI001EDE5C83|nr:hypothetical protein [Photobacterium leiognathi]MCG3884473.1 hypothetical protein [Photobacterium leiognathi]